jgi:PTS system mannose-specific IIB component/fructoselysine and glucoselysine-specific PTS system IIB component
VPVDLYRIDDRLIHGQVVVGWGQPMQLGFIVLVDDEVGVSDWEQDLYRTGVPPGVEVFFDTVEQAAARHARYAADPRPGVLLTGAIETMLRLADLVPAIRRVNVGGVHHQAGRTQHLRYVFLTPDEREALRTLAARGVEVSAQDVPSARPVPLADLLDGRAGA